MLNNLQRSRFIIWSVVILFLIVGLLSASKTVEEEATNTAFIVASKRILDQANLFKQDYLLKGAEQQSDSESPKSYSRTGWIMPIQGSKVDCHYWLDQLYPPKSILGLNSPRAEDQSDNMQFHCVYHYGDKYHINILLKNERFNVLANILAL
ncbi:MSHA biogenesis protein MshF [Vibrio lentus]|uniref:MSHA biogenesis protein MshF n=1 Tax=Vibrio lentus TaxID=136468 RepID=UPI000C835DDD|nr:MSHA biogenesis protein MshF [Vibrio lentus]PMI98819.1 MSHA biogenesis protein MshF [Vibrio lentus]PMJ17327.1 MSHA biogenesis protein MshF [Vibrio lentus]